MNTKVPSKIRQLIERWHARVRSAEDELQDHRMGGVIRRMVTELEEAIQAELDEFLDADEAAAFSGLGKDQLRRTIPNRGSKYRPRYRKGDLPTKASAPDESRLPRILQLATEVPDSAEESRREQIRQQARETARQVRRAG
ncbi:MAG TPA: hypothetical protein VFQ10_09230 [Rubrobacter sp.]|nr:hypothetical protein [Rubrobacter sp.]